MTQSEIGQQLAEIAPIAAFPPAGSEITFQSPFPILIDGATYPMTARFSAYDDDNGSQVVIFWAQTTNSDGKFVTVPISEFTKKQGADSWETLNLVNTPWSVEFTVNPNLNIVYNCNKATSDGSSFELECQKK